jgi:nucleoid-associated protein YgaU
MFQKGSRYANARLFNPAPDGETAFAGLRPRPIGPSTGVIEHVVKAGERLDLLARHYYNDNRLWWRIVDANPAYLFGADMLLEEMEGQIILIPKARE